MINFLLSKLYNLKFLVKSLFSNPLAYTSWFLPLLKIIPKLCTLKTQDSVLADLKYQLRRTHYDVITTRVFCTCSGIDADSFVTPWLRDTLSALSV